MMDLGFVAHCDSFETTFSVISITQTEANQGEVTDVRSAPAEFTGIITPVAPATNLQFMEEGERIDNLIRIQTTEVIVCGDAVVKNSDIVIWQGVEYRVKGQPDWNEYGFYVTFAEGMQNG